MTIFVSSCRNKLTKKYAKKNGTPCSRYEYKKRGANHKLDYKYFFAKRNAAVVRLAYRDSPKHINHQKGYNFDFLKINHRFIS